jgi:hypothetical protein
VGDILVGAVLGAAVGLAVGVAGRLSLRRRETSAVAQQT